MALQVGVRRSCSTFLRCLPNVIGGSPVLSVAGGVTKLPVATLRATFGDKYPYEKPFPYEEWPLHPFSFAQDYTQWRFNENTKVVIVEGNIAVGKTEFAKGIAERFDLKYFPPTREKQLFLDKDYNYDTRGFDSILPEGVQSYDLKKFYSDPHPERGLVGRLQLLWYEERFMDYLLALRHLANTGQGVVLARSAYSDIVFVDALLRMGWLTKNFQEYYLKGRESSLCEVFAPHLHIYLDAPVKVLRERINKRNQPFEVGSRNLTDEYLEAIDYAYKEIYLPETRKTAQVVEVDWTEVGDDVDMDMIAMELEHVKLDTDDKDAIIFGDWHRISEEEWTDFRMHVEDPHWRKTIFSWPQPWNCDEIMPSPEDMQALGKFVISHPVYRYKSGWAPEFGHKTSWRFRNPLSYLSARMPETIDLRKIFTG